MPEFLPPNTLIENGWLTGIPWAEVQGHGGPTSILRLGYGGNTASMTIQVYWEDLFSAAIQLVGTHYYDPATSNLDRTPALQHPQAQQLYVSAIEIHPQAFRGKLEGDNGNPSQSDYLFGLINIQFTMPRYRVLTDAQLQAEYGLPRQEWQRYCNKQNMPQSSVIQRQGGSAFQYADVVTGAVPNSVNQTLLEKELHITWMMIPSAGWYSSKGDGPPINQDFCLNSANINPIMGYPAQTLLFKDYRLTEIESPVTNPSFNPVGRPPLYYNVDLIWKYCLRPVDPASALGQQGWLAYPKSGKPWWYLATYNGVASSAQPPPTGVDGGLVPLRDHSLIFTLNP